MATCDYIETYFDINTDEEIPFDCDEDVYESGKCKFHLEGYLKEETKDDIIRLFSQKLDEVKEDEPLLCIGYILPSIPLLKNNEKEFKIPAYFAHAKFKLENLNLSHITFKKEISFYQTEFFNSTSLRASVFEGPVDFSYSQFHEESNSFESTKFKKTSDFSHSTLKNTNFEWASFSKAEFIECKFFDETIFENATFGDVYFKKAEFLGNTVFSESIFTATANFEDAKFLQFADFSKVHFNKKENITFNGNISNVSFADTDIKQINFGNRISWELIESSDDKEGKTDSVKKGKNNDFKTYEERLLEENDETKINLESIKNIYRDLRDNFDLNLRYDIAGKFFVREMELKRKYKEKRVEGRLITTKKPICHRILTLYWLYNILAQYGQSYYRPMYFAIPIIFIGTFFFWVECTEQEEIDLQEPCDDSLVSAFIRSLSSFIPFFTFTDTPSTIDYVLRLTLLPISGTFFIALKRRFERKLRH